MISIHSLLKGRLVRLLSRPRSLGPFKLSRPASATFQPCAQQHTDTFWEDREESPFHLTCFQLFPNLHCPGAGSNITAHPGHVPRPLSHPCVPPLGRWHSWTPGLIVTFDPSVHLHQAPDHSLPVVPLPDVHFCGEVAIGGLRVDQKHGHARL